MTRREVLGRIGAAGLALGVWSGSSAREAGVVRIGVGSAGVAGTLEGDDPLGLAASSGYGPGGLLASGLHRGLVELTGRGTVVAGIARRWRESSDRLEWWFELVDGVDVRGVARYLSRVCSVRGRAARTRIAFETSSLVQVWYVRGGSLLVARLHHPVSTFPRLLAGSAYRVPERASGVPGAFWLKTAGAGDEATVYRLRVRPGPSGAVPVSGVDVVVVGDPAERLARVRSGDLDYGVGVEGVDPGEHGLRDVRVHVHACERVPMILARSGGYPASDQGAVGALKAVFDAGTLLREGFSGRGTVAPGAPLPESFHGMVGTLVCLPSLAAAVEVLRRGSGRIGVLRVAEPGFVRMGRSCVGQLRSVAGVELSLDTSKQDRTGTRLGGLELVPLELGLDPRVVFRYLLSAVDSGVRWATDDLRMLSRHTFLAGTASVRTDRLRRMATDFACRASAMVPVMPHRIDVSSPRVGGGLPGGRRPVRFSADALLSRIVVD